jgi:ribonuclease J
MTVTTVAGAPAVEFIPLGGIGEFGMNMHLLVCGETALLIDAGVMFPEPELFGVDLVLPDLSALDPWKGKIQALVLTHGHEDHIGGVPHVWPIFDGPVFGTEFTLALVKPKLDEHGITAGDRLVVVKPRQIVDVGVFKIEFLRVPHSIPDCVALAIHTPQGVILHTGDFKIDQTPLDGETFDYHRFAELGSQGVLALFSDSTNADCPGYTGSERDVIDGFDEIFSAAPAKIIVSTFSTSMYRIQLLVDMAEQFERKVAFLGRSMQQNTAIAMELGRLRVPVAMQIRDSDVRDYPSQDVLCICTGSQGEPMAALPRMAIDDHRHIKINSDDVVAFSARVIPGNEKAIARVMNNVARRGAEIVVDGSRHIHVSGHGSAEELKLVLSLARPKVFVPIHGEYRQLSRHARMAPLVSPGSHVLIIEDGDVVRFENGDGQVVGKVPTGRIFVDGTRTGEIGDEVLRDRRHLAGDGLVVCVVAINGQTGAIEQAPEVIGRGLAIDARHDAMLKDAPEWLVQVVEGASTEERRDPGLLKERIRLEMQRMFRKRAGRRPLVLPVVLEV